jgi:hypothetical protein
MLFGHQSSRQPDSANAGTTNNDAAAPTQSSDAGNSIGYAGAPVVQPEPATPAPTPDPIANDPIKQVEEAPTPVAESSDQPPAESDYLTALQNEEESAETESAEPPAASTSASSTPDDDLLNLKQQALEELSPLVEHLEQTPEEKFRTTMMMIQSTDNQALIKDAYEAAQAIPDDKARAQALLDVVNEINYFTQKN